jgi:glycosyltransferase involved in cell wall biosynthesis
MTARPLVSVITPTWQRPKLLRACIENVRAQVYRPLEHVIVSDGRDDELVAAMRRWGFVSAMRLAEAGCDAGTVDVPIQTVHLGRNWSTFLPDSFCAAPVTVGMLVASGEYQTWLADDEVMDPEHIAALVAALEAAGADFAYSRVRMHHVGAQPEQGYEIGADRPQMGQITNCLYRADLLKRGLYPFGAGMTSDWACIQRWMQAGATWAYVPRVTLTHRIDH